jgi:hypothetical protein
MSPLPHLLWRQNSTLQRTPETQVCEITEEKPDGTKLVMVGTEAYPTRDEAKAARKAAKKAGECKRADKPASEGGQ